VSDDGEWYRILREMNEKDRKAWNQMQQRHLEEMQGIQNAADREAQLKRQDAEREAFKEAYTQELHQQREEQFDQLPREREEQLSEPAREQGEAEITSKFFDAKEQQRLADEAQKAALDEQALQQDEAAKAQIAAQELGVADTAREQEAIQKRNAEIIEQNNQIQRELEAGTLQPVAQEKVKEAIRLQYDERREAVSQSIADLRQQEIDKTIGGIDDPEMAEYLAQQQKEIDEKYARLEAERLSALEREERARLERAVEPYAR
jgi:hypothetical protein